MSFELKDRVTVDDRKMKTNSLSGSVIGVDKTIEGTRIYTVQVETKSPKGRVIKKQVVNLLENQLIKESNV